MGRPPLPLGTFGKIVHLRLPSGKIQARVRFRDQDGAVRQVARSGRSRAAAERALKAALTERITQGRAGIGPSMRVDALADSWLEAPNTWSTGTERTYRSVVRNQIKPTIGKLQVREVSPGIVGRALATIAATSGASAAKSAKACMSGMFGLAVADGAIPSNPVKDSPAKISVPRRSPRALTPEETLRLRTLFSNSARAQELDLVDLVSWMLATGCRLGEALAARYGRGSDGRPMLDLDAGTWEVCGTVVRVSGRGLVVQPRPKTAAGWRTIALPDHALALLAWRGRASELVFHSGGGPRDPNNVSGDLRRLLDSFDCDVCQRTGVRRSADGRARRCDEGPWSWVTSHTFRKTVATRLDEAGLSAREIADQLGHANPSMTLDVYCGRRVVSAAAAAILEAS